jgi:hypothetical protein
MRRPQHEASPLRSGVASRLDESARLVALAARSAQEVSSTPGYWEQPLPGGGASSGGAYSALPPPPRLSDGAAQAAFGARLAALALADAEEARLALCGAGECTRLSHTR